jgi:ATP-binding cassette subfamily F protein 3
VCTHIAHLENLKIYTYTGNYDTFEKTRREKREHTAKENEKLLRAKAHIQSFINRFRYKATKAKQAQSRIKWLAKLGDEVEIISDPQISFHFPTPKPELASPIIKLEDVSVGYDKKTILSKLNLRIDSDSRIALLGANGNGKSTLAKLLAKKIIKQSGYLEQNNKLSIAYFSQSLSDELNLEMNAYNHIYNLNPKESEVNIRAHLARFGIGENLISTPVQNLSGGEKARLSLALIMRNHPQLLILDEPTNHLDMISRQALSEAINDYLGAVILITHDLYLIEATCDDLWLVNKGACRNFDGDMNDYREFLLGNKKKAPASTSKPTQPSETVSSQPRTLSNLERQAKLKDAEEKLETLNQMKLELERTLIAEFSAEVQRKLSQVYVAIEKHEQLWLDLQSY